MLLRPAKPASAYYPYQPVKERGSLRSFLLALLMHVLLGIVLYYGVHWQSSTPVGAEAELWTEVPDTTPPPPEPIPAPRPVPVPPQPQVKAPVDEQADIALERQKRREAERKEAERQEAQRQEAQRKADLAKQEQQRKDQARREEQARQDLARKEDQKRKDDAAKKQAQQQAQQDQQRKEQAERERKEADARAKADAQAKAKADAAAKAKADAAASAQRRAELARLQALAGGGVPGGAGGVGNSPGAGAGQGGKASPGYADRVRRRVKPNIVFTEDIAGNPSAVVTVQLAPDGSLLSARLSKSSGNAGWDNAVLRAVERSDPLPRDENGKAPPTFNITFHPKD